MKKLGLLILVCCLIAIIGCSKDEPTGPGSGDGAQIWPLKAGNNWSYIDDANPGTVSRRLRIVGTESLAKSNLVDVFTVVMEEVATSDTDTMLVRNESDGIHFYEDNGGHALVFKYPVSAGDSWDNPFESVSITCMSTNEAVQTPAGNFTCIVYRLADTGDIAQGTYYLELYMAPGVGWVADHSPADGGQPEQWHRLNSYQVN